MNLRLHYRWVAKHTAEQTGKLLIEICLAGNFCFSPCRKNFLFVPRFTDKYFSVSWFCAIYFTFLNRKRRSTWKFLSNSSKIGYIKSGIIPISFYLRFPWFSFRWIHFHCRQPIRSCYLSCLLAHSSHSDWVLSQVPHIASVCLVFTDLCSFHCWSSKLILLLLEITNLPSCCEEDFAIL